MFKRHKRSQHFFLTHDAVVIDQVTIMLALLLVRPTRHSQFKESRRSKQRRAERKFIHTQSTYWFDCNNHEA